MEGIGKTDEEAQDIEMEPPPSEQPAMRRPIPMIGQTIVNGDDSGSSTQSEESEDEEAVFEREALEEFHQHDWFQIGTEAEVESFQAMAWTESDHEEFPHFVVEHEW